MTTTTATALTTIYLRPSPRFPKIVALAVLLDHLYRSGQPQPEIIMMQADEQPSGDGIYQLDCGPNEYRKREFGTELEVVLNDFKIETDDALDEVIDRLYKHNQGDENRQLQFHMNQGFGSVGYFTGFAWTLIDELPADHWRWVRPERKPSAKQFLTMVVNVIAAHLAALRCKPELRKDWKQGEQLPQIKALLDAKFEGSDLSMRKVRNGNLAFPTISRYIRDLYELGTDPAAIKERMVPWFRLWEVAGDCYDDAESLKPTEKIDIYPNFGGVAFDVATLGRAAEGNPLIHQRWLAKRDEHGDRLYGVVIMRKASGHKAIFVRGYEARVEELAGFLQAIDHGRWHFQGGMAIYNGSHSRTEVPPSRILVAGNGETLLWYAKIVITGTYYFAQGGMLGNPRPALE